VHRRSFIKLFRILGVFALAAQWPFGRSTQRPNLITGA
jgi:hypothetical protein